MPASSATMMGRADGPNTSREDNAPPTTAERRKGRRAGYLTEGPEQEPEKWLQSGVIVNRGCHDSTLRHDVYIRYLPGC